MHLISKITESTLKTSIASKYLVVFKQFRSGFLSTEVEIIPHVDNNFAFFNFQVLVSQRHLIKVNVRKHRGL